MKFFAISPKSISAKKSSVIANISVIFLIAFGITPSSPKKNSDNLNGLASSEPNEKISLTAFTARLTGYVTISNKLPNSVLKFSILKSPEKIAFTESIASPTTPSAN